MKAIAVILLICVFGFCGFIYAYALKKRSKELATFAFGMELLETEIVYAKNPLWLCFSNAAKSMEGQGAHFFGNVGEALKENVFSTGEECFVELLKAEEPHLSLEPKDLDILRYFASNLGCTDEKRQQEKIRSAKSALDYALKSAKEQETKWGRVTGVGGWLFGIVVGLLLI